MTKKNTPETNAYGTTDEYPIGKTRGPDVDSSFPTYTFDDPVDHDGKPIKQTKSRAKSEVKHTEGGPGQGPDGTSGGEGGEPGQKPGENKPEK